VLLTRPPRPGHPRQPGDLIQEGRSRPDFPAAGLLADHAGTPSLIAVLPNEDRAVRLLRAGSGRRQSVCAPHELGSPKVLGHLAR